MPGYEANNLLTIPSEASRALPMEEIVRRLRLPRRFLESADPSVALAKLLHQVRHPRMDPALLEQYQTESQLLDLESGWVYIPTVWERILDD